MSIPQTQTPQPHRDGLTAGGRARWAGARRLSRGHWLAIVLGVLAAVAVYVALLDRGEVVLVAVADRQVAAGRPVTGDVVRWVEVPAGSAMVDGLVSEAYLAGGQWVASRPIQSGEPLTVQALAGVGEVEGARSMSVPVPRERAVGGALVTGDRVDVVNVADAGEAVYVVTDAEVLAVGGEASGSVGEAPRTFHVVLAVDAAEALRLAAAMADGQVDVVRSTGAPPAQVSTGVAVPEASSGRGSAEGEG